MLVRSADAQFARSHRNFRLAGRDSRFTLAVVVAGVMNRAKRPVEDGAQPVGSNPGLNTKIGMASAGGSRERTEPRKRFVRIAIVVLALAFRSLAGRAMAQGPTVDTSVPGFLVRVARCLGQRPVRAGGSFLNLPGRGAFWAGGRACRRPRAFPRRFRRPGLGPDRRICKCRSRHPSRRRLTDDDAILRDAGILAQDNDGPPDGVTLDQAIDITLERSLDLRASSWRSRWRAPTSCRRTCGPTPIFYQDGQLLQYRGTSTAFSGQRRAGRASSTPTSAIRSTSRTNGRRGRWSPHVPSEFLRRYTKTPFGSGSMTSTALSSLHWRRVRRFATRSQSVEGLIDVLDANEERFKKGDISQAELNQVRIRLRTARLGLVDAEAAYRKAKLDLGSLMNLKLEEIDRSSSRNNLRRRLLRLRSAEELRKLASPNDPTSCRSDWESTGPRPTSGLPRLTHYSDVYVLWQPYTFQDNTPYGLKSQYSWALGVTVPLPIYNRNQGGILGPRST